MSDAARRIGAAAGPVDPFHRVLAGLGEDRLTALLERRADLATPPPRGAADLLRRAADARSISRAVDDLDRFTLDVVRAAMALNSRAGSAQISEALGLPGDAHMVEAAVSKAEGLLLMATDDCRIIPHPGLPLVISAPQLGPPLKDALAGLAVDELQWIARYRHAGLRAKRKAQMVPELAAVLAEPGGIESLVRSGPPEAVSLVRRLARDGRALQHSSYSLYPRYGSTRDRAPGGPLEWLAWNGLVVRHDYYCCVVPREVALTLNGGHLLAGVQPERPALAPTGADGDVDAGACAAAIGAVGDVETLVELLSAAPGKLLKHGGLGVREVRRLAKAAEIGEERAALLLEIAAASALIGQVGECADGTGELLPTERYDHWSGDEVAERWAVLAEAWLTAERFLSIAATKDADGKPLPALVPLPAATEAVRQREVVLDRLAELPEQNAAAREALAAAACWDAPLAMATGPGTEVEHLQWVLEEAGVLGLVERDSLSVLGRRVAARDLDGATSALARSAGPSSTEIVLQADLTAMAPGRAPRRFRDLLGQIADVESKGGATVYRFSKSSLRRGFDAGLTASDVLRFLGEHAVHGVPQPLSYLVEDVARAHGSIRVGAVRSYIRCADEAMAADIARARKCGGLGLRVIAPMVLVSPHPPEAVLASLRSAGYMPAHEDSSGGLVLAGGADRRASSRVAGAPPPARAGDGRREAAADVARRLVSAGLSGDETDPSLGRRSGGTNDSSPGEAAGRRRFPERDAFELLRLFRSKEIDEMMTQRQLADLLGVGGDQLDVDPEGDDDAYECPRPSDIVRSPAAVEQALDHAAVHDWVVRLALKSKRGDLDHVNAFVDKVAAGRVTLWDLVEGDELRVGSSEIAWVRVLTEAEENAFVEGAEVDI